MKKRQIIILFCVAIVLIGIGIRIYAVGVSPTHGSTEVLVNLPGTGETHTMTLQEGVNARAFSMGATADGTQEIIVSHPDSEILVNIAGVGTMTFQEAIDNNLICPTGETPPQGPPEIPSSGYGCGGEQGCIAQGGTISETCYCTEYEVVVDTNCPDVVPDYICPKASGFTMLKCSLTTMCKMTGAGQYRLSESPSGDWMSWKDGDTFMCERAFPLTTDTTCSDTVESTSEFYWQVRAGPPCGDGNVDFIDCETCDDGNTVSGDGCSGGCIIEYGYGCAGEPSTCSLLTGTWTDSGNSFCTTSCSGNDPSYASLVGSSCDIVDNTAISCDFSFNACGWPGDYLRSIFLCV